MKSRRNTAPKRKSPLKPMTPGQIQKFNPSTSTPLSTAPSKSLSELMAEIKNKKETGKDIIVPLSKNSAIVDIIEKKQNGDCLLYTSPSPRDGLLSRMPSSA